MAELGALDPGRGADELGQVVAQKVNGARFYDVKDTGQALGYGVRRSVTNLGQPFHTDGGNLILDCDFGLIADPAALDQAIGQTIGVVETGLFIGMASMALVADHTGVHRIVSPSADH